MTVEQAIRILEQEEFIVSKDGLDRFSLTSPGKVWFRDARAATLIIFAMGIQQMVAEVESTLVNKVRSAIEKGGATRA